MQNFDVQGVEISATTLTIFDFVRNPANLPRWAHAFASADEEQARLKTPSGSVDIALRTRSNSEAATIDWELGFPDGSTGIAQSRVTATSRGTSIYSFVLHAPPVPLEQLEGALEAQRATLATELNELQRILEAR